MSIDNFFDLTLFGTTFATLFVIQDPAGGLPVFLALTSTKSAEDRRRAARMAALTSFFVITVFVLFGRYIFAFLGISAHSLRLSGGLVLLLIALDLLAGKVEQEEDSGDSNVNVALVPLGTPLLAGPGAIVAAMLAIEKAGPSVASWLAVGTAIVLIHVVIWLTFHYAVHVNRLLGVGGTLLLTRIAGLLLAAIAAEMVAAGVLGFMEESSLFAG
ncbi:MarC family protein [Buchananella hordeovulneris]|uniref:UPF0056 membrane protein n=1 Tax=Buchananella hordeovulneris TaxID=52770 RepID=A0A1Q5PVK9_9ACTO|nr:MarC family protein [Buchananella hordeovulneris]MDO5080701.1 MarC family protein [Buchananella hordeovulneris]OKL51643.1 antibiotic resistance protein MarC [Buchananella hordeovulneris]RRD42364.1 NAAT family transporter [Buchananella hordeovulneris]RRD50844.1 NAAT family transporter [Buchananella hordeovulneris]